MSMQKLEDVLKHIWPTVRERHFYPALPAPTISKGNDRVALEMKGKKISLSSAFVSEMSHRLNPRLILEGLLDHAVSHYIYCPWDFSTHLMLYMEAKSVIQDKGLARKAADAFMDVVADTFCVTRNETPLPDIYRSLPKGRLDEAVCALYQKIWGVDLGVERFEDIATKLSHIPYLNRNLWPDSIRRFASVIQELIGEEASEDGSEKTSAMGDHPLEQYSPREIEEGLKLLASSAATPAEFKEIFLDIQEDISNALGEKGHRIGQGKGDCLDADMLFYMKLAQNFALPVRKRLMEKSGALYPHHHVPWEAGKPFDDIDPWKSFGKVMPGLTKSWQRIEGDMYGQDDGTPDCIVIIDSSASMLDPHKHISHAIVGAACAAEAYLRNGARVAVYNFSDASAGDEYMLSYTRNREKIYGAICRYYGGGTHLFVKTIQTFQTEPPPDIFLMTDMQMINLDNLVRYFNACRNRITAVLVGKNKHVNAFRQRMALNRNVQIYGVEKLEDIPGIVLGKIREYLYRDQACISVK